MSRRNSHTIGMLLALAVLWAAAPADAVVQVMLGEQDFNDGVLVDESVFNNAQSGEPAPFDGVRGSDFGAGFSATWTHTFNPADFADDEHDDGMGGTYTGFNFMSVEVGLYDHDTEAPGSQLQTFTLNGVDIWGMADEVFESGFTTFGTPAGENRQYNIYRFIFDIDDPATAALANAIAGTPQFADGELEILLEFQGPSLIVPPPPTGSGNGVGLDYSILRINTPAGDDFPPVVIPEPATASLALLAMAGLVARTRRRR